MPATKNLGRFVWYDLMTKDVESAKQFYTELLGWRIERADVAYDMIHVGETGIGGMALLEGPGTEGVPPHWIAYVGTDDVEACCKRVEAAGGTVRVPPTKIPSGVGRFAVIADPKDAVISAFEASEELDLPSQPQLHTFTWNELHSDDPEGAKAFYGEVFGWSFKSSDMGPMGTYHHVQVGDIDIGGMMALPPDAEAPPAWMPYISVENVDELASKAESLGASTFVAPQDIPGVGRFSVHADPTGATFAFYAGAH